MSLTFIPSLWHLTRSSLLLMNKQEKKTKAQLAIYIWIQPVAQGEDDRDSRHATCLRYFYEKKREKKSLLALRGSRDFPAQSGIFIPIIREIQQEIQIASSLLFSLSLFFFSLYKSCAFSLLNCLLSQLVNK